MSLLVDGGFFQRAGACCEQSPRNTCQLPFSSTGGAFSRLEEVIGTGFITHLRCQETEGRECSRPSRHFYWFIGYLWQTLPPLDGEVWSGRRTRAPPTSGCHSVSSIQSL